MQPAHPEVVSADAHDGRTAVTLRAVVVAIVLTAVAALWVQQVELLLHTAEITEATPVIPAIAGLLCVLSVHAGWRRTLGFAVAHPKRCLWA